MAPVTIVLTYHRVLPEPGSAAVSCHVFRQQLEYLRKRGFTFIDLDSMQCLLDGGQSVSTGHTALITFDDGWADNLFHASPILKEFGIHAVLALNTGLVNPEPVERTRSTFVSVGSKTALADAVYRRDYRSFLTWPEIRLLKERDNWTIAAHGNSHLGSYRDLENIRGFHPLRTHWTLEHALGEPPFEGAPVVRFVSDLAQRRTRLAPDLVQTLKIAPSDSQRKAICRNHPEPVVPIETLEQFETRIRNDFTVCRNEIENRLGECSRSFFWPWGHDSQLARNVVHGCGFRYLFTMQKEVVEHRNRGESVPRIAAPPTLAAFQKQVRIFSSPILRKLRRWLRILRPHDGVTL